MLQEILSTSPLSQYLSKPYHPFPHYDERNKWDALSAEAREFFMNKAESLQGKPWASLPAAYYLDFARKGDRQQYETLCFKRRSDLLVLLVAECIEGSGRFIDDIINGCWLICEESTWVVPAHNAHFHCEGLPMALPNKEADIYIDLFSAETGALLSWVYYFLKDELDKVTPLVSRRIEIEMNQRILAPFLAYEDYWWLGLDHENPVNNWNPWINSNVLIAFLVLAPDVSTKVAGVEKIARSLDRFLYFYHEDGGCDEGPSYFNVAGASLLDCVETLAGVVPEIARLYDNEKIKNIAGYIAKVYIGKDYYVNFADAPVRTKASAIFLYRMGEKLGDKNLMGFGYHLRSIATGPEEVYNAGGRTTFRALSDIFWPPLTPPLTPVAYEPPAVSWFEGIQVMTIRDRKPPSHPSSPTHSSSSSPSSPPSSSSPSSQETGAGGSRGLFVAAKGGHNEESHNHNDIGNFIVYYNDRPVIVDAGVGIYEKRTFSSERYDIWTMRSGYHNTPTINGFEQLPGQKQQAEAVVFQTDAAVTSLCMDIHKAYPEEARVVRYNRSFVFRHGVGLEVTDRYALRGSIASSSSLSPLSVPSPSPSPLVFNFMCYNQPEACPEGLLLDVDGPVVLGFDTERFDIDVEDIPLTDARLRQGWEKDVLYRLRLTPRMPKAEGEARFLITTGR